MFVVVLQPPIITNCIRIVASQAHVPVQLLTFIITFQFSYQETFQSSAQQGRFL
jgi:hypothetical protein